MLLGCFLQRLSVNLSGCRGRSIECNATSGLRFQIWRIVHPNLFMNFCRLAKAAEFIQWDLLVAYCALKRLTRVPKLSIDLGGSPLYQVSATPLKDIGKTWHRIMLSLVYRFAWVRKASRCSFGSVVQSYCSRLSGFHPKGMPTRQRMWERLKSSTVLTMRRECDSP